MLTNFKQKSLIVAEIVFGIFLAISSAAGVAAEIVQPKHTEQAVIQQQSPAEHEDVHTHQDENPYPFPPTFKAGGIVATSTTVSGAIGQRPAQQFV
jgi:hypothetical protein